MTTVLEPPTILAVGKPPYINEGGDAPAPRGPRESGETTGDDDVESGAESESGDA